MIIDNNDNITKLKQEVEELKAKLDSMGSEEVDVIYDMRSEDETINLGMTSGMVGYQTINVDLSQYKKIRLYAIVLNAEVQKEVDLVNRYKYDTTFVGASASALIYGIFKVVIPEAKTRIQTGMYSMWQYSIDNQAWTITAEKTHERVYLYRIEGIKE